MCGSVRVKFLNRFRHRHQRWRVAPKMIRAIIPARPPDPLLRATHILNDHRNVMARDLDGLAMNSEAGIEQRGKALALGRIGEDLPALFLRLRPRHSHVREFLTRRAWGDQRGVLELLAVQRENVLQYELRWILNEPRSRLGVRPFHPKRDSAALRPAAILYGLRAF